MPTRVLEICEKQPGESRRVKLLSTNRSKGSYAALSYAWGGKSDFQTTEANIKEMEAGFVTTRLPTTLYDAARVTHSLGVKYLWVDALCIIQDSDEDKAQEIQRMGEVYSQAICTISATNAEHASKGFLEKEFCEEGITRLPFICPGGEVGAMYLRKAGWYEAGSEPLNKRAWAFQERLLSPKFLDYTSLHVAWQCRSTRHRQQDREGRDFYKSNRRGPGECLLDSQLEPVPGWLEHAIFQVKRSFFRLVVKGLMGNAVRIPAYNDNGEQVKMNGVRARAEPDDLDTWEKQASGVIIYIEVWRTREEDVRGWSSQGLCLEYAGRKGCYRRIGYYSEWVREKKGAMFDKCQVHQIAII